VSDPEMLMFYSKKERSSRRALLICPGGGYRLLTLTNEEYLIAERLNKKRITAFILKYRLHSDEIMIDKTINI